MIAIESVKPRSGYRHYSNPSCQGSLIRQTQEWPIGRPSLVYGNSFGIYGGYCEKMKDEAEREKAGVPNGLSIDSAYLDRMADWDRDKLDHAWKHLSRGLDSPDDELLAFVRAYFNVDVVAVRTVFYYNVSTGYPCERVDYLYRASPAASS